MKLIHIIFYIFAVIIALPLIGLYKFTSLFIKRKSEKVKYEDYY